MTEKVVRLEEMASKQSSLTSKNLKETTELKEMFQTFLLGISDLRKDLEEIKKIPREQQHNACCAGNYCNNNWSIPKHLEIKPPGKTDDYTFGNGKLTFEEFRRRTFAVFDGFPQASDRAKYSYLSKHTVGKVHEMVQDFMSHENAFEEVWEAIDNTGSQESEYDDITVELMDVPKEPADKNLRGIQKVLCSLSRFERQGLEEDDPSMSNHTLVCRTAYKRLHEAARLRYKELNPNVTQKEYFQNAENRKTLRVFVQTAWLGKKGSERDESTEKAVTKKCEWCQKNHHVSTCFTFEKQPLNSKWKFVKDKNLCQQCLGRHGNRECQRAKCLKCGKGHHTHLHNNEGPKEKVQHSNAIIRSSQALMLLRSEVKGTQVKDKALIMLDMGSTHTLMSKRLANIVQPEIKERNRKIKMTTINGETDEVVDVGMVVIGKEKKYKIELLIREKLPRVTQRALTPSDYKEWPQLYPLQTTRASNEEVDLLIGCDCLHLIIHKEVWNAEMVDNDAHGPRAIRTSLGWSVVGLPRDMDVCDNNKIVIVDDDNDQLSSSKEDPRERLLSLEDEEAMEVLDETFNINTMSAAIPFRTNKDELVKNRSMAEQRIFMLLNRVRRDPQLEEQYDYEIAELLRNNYAERKSDAEIQWYLPHHPVRNPKKDRIRVVFDCRAKNKELGLNDVIMSGPNAINDLWNILLQFCTRKHYALSDIQAMFLQIRLQERDKAYFGFLYWELGHPKTRYNVVEYVMTRHVFGAASSPFVACESLKRLIHHSKELSDEQKTTVTKQFYVDDFVCCSDDPEYITSTVFAVREAIRPHFNLRKFYSNSEKLMEGLEEEDKLTPTQVLGLSFDPSEDSIAIDLSPLHQTANTL